MDVATPPPAPDAKSQAPLLPSVFSNPAAFLWFWVLPIGVMLLLNLQGYWVIEGNMDKSQQREALLLGGSGLANILAGFAIYLVTRRLARSPKSVRTWHPWWGLAPVLAQIAYLWLAVITVDSVLPSNVTAWIYPPERFLFNQFAFAMLPLFLGILRLACGRSERGFVSSITMSLGAAIAAPVFLYLGVNLLGWFKCLDAIGPSLFATGIIVLGLVMFVGIIRALMLALRRAQNFGSAGERVAIVLFALVLPAGGLWLNRSIPFPVDFQALEVYVLLAANFAVLLLASWKHASWPRLSFCLLCATLPYSLYFFIVFLPYTPLSIIAVIVVGAGFLVLTPTFLFTLHLYLLNKARCAVMPGHGWSRIALGGFLCFLILPAFFTVRGLADKAALNSALDYLFTPSIHGGNTTYPASRTNLRRALTSHRSYKNGIYYPLLSDYNSWLVFDNLILPDDKIARLESTFFGTRGSPDNHDPMARRTNSFFGSDVRARGRMPRATPPPQTVEVQNLDVRILPSNGASAICTLALTLQNTGHAAAEYRKILPLPPGVFVSGFRLHINGAPVSGRIFEKKTALWVYAMIRDSDHRIDPGILTYNRPGELELRVYPVNPNAPTTVEIDFLLPPEVSLSREQIITKDPADILNKLADSLTPQLASGSRGSLVAGGLASLHLPATEREPYLHLIVDRSADNGFTGDLPAALRILQERFPNARRARITVANYNVIDLVAPLTPIGELITHNPLEQGSVPPCSGGLALDLALAHCIRQHGESELDQASAQEGIPPRPVFVILSRKAGPRAMEHEIADAWSDLLPGLEIHELGMDGVLVTHQKAAAPALPLLRLGHSVRPLAPGAIIRFKATSASDRLEYWDPATAVWTPVPNTKRQADSTPWAQAASLQLQQQDRNRDPGGFDNDLEALVKASRDNGILVAATSYIVVENSAQWKTLELSQGQKLGQNAALDFREAPAPPALVIGLCFLLWIIIRKWLGALKLRCQRRLTIGRA